MKCFNGRDVNVKDESTGQTAMHLAASAGNYEMVDALLNRGASVDIEDQEGHLPVHKAVLSGHFDMVRELFEAGNYTDETVTEIVNKPVGKDRWGMMHMACIAGYVDLYQWLENQVRPREYLQDMISI